jgi:Protein of unknown function (DUF3551)
MRLRLFTIVMALAASTLLGGWAFDRQGSYCVFDKDYTNCGYDSWKACLEAARAAGNGMCRENPMYSEERASRRQRVR